MKIAYLSTFYPYRGGIAQFNAALYREFEKNHDINAYTFTRQYPEKLFPGKTQMVTEGDIADKIPAQRLLDTINPATYGKTAKVINNFHPDIMIMKYWMPFFAPSLGRISKRTGKNGTVNIAVLDNVIPHEKRPGDLLLTKYFLDRVHGFIVMSQAVQNDLVSLKRNAIYEFQEHPLYDHFGKKLDKAEARKKLSIPQDKKVLLFFGLIRDYKGLDLLLDAMSKLPEEYFLIIAGEPYTDFNKYEVQINQHKLGDRVYKHINYVDDNDVPTFFSAADVCMLPYKTATQSGITGIAYHFDLPIIATDTGGLKEMIAPYNTGIMVGEINPEAIRNAVLDYFNNSDINNLIHNIGKYKEIASWAKLAEKIEKLYMRVKANK